MCVWGRGYSRACLCEDGGEKDAVLATERVNSHIVPEDGSITCTETGTCKLCVYMSVCMGEGDEGGGGIHAHVCVWTGERKTLYWPQRESTATSFRRTAASPARRLAPVSCVCA